MDEAEAVHHARDWAPSKALGLRDLQKNRDEPREFGSKMKSGGSSGI
jgi:hypothetical protein